MPDCFVVSLTIFTELVVGLNVTASAFAAAHGNPLRITILFFWCWILLALPVSRFVYPKYRNTPNQPNEDVESSSASLGRVLFRRMLVAHAVASILPTLILLILYGCWVYNIQSDPDSPGLDCSRLTSDSQSLSCNITRFIVIGAFISIGWLLIDVAVVISEDKKNLRRVAVRPNQDVQQIQS